MCPLARRSRCRWRSANPADHDRVTLPLPDPVALHIVACLAHRPANCRGRPLPPRLSGWALTRFYSPLKSRLYGGAALVVTPHAPGVLIRYFCKISHQERAKYSRSMM